MFAREPNDRLTSLVKKLDARLESAKKGQRPLGAYVIFSTTDADLEMRLRSDMACAGVARVSFGLGAPRPAYDVSPEAEATIVIYNPERPARQRVLANFAFRPGELDDVKADAVARALDAALPR